MREIESYESVQRVLEVLSDNSKIQFHSILKQFLQFRNSEEGLLREINPDMLIDEAKENIDVTQKHLDSFYLWIQGEKVKGFGQGFTLLRSGKKRPIKVKPSTAFSRTYGNLRGFYVNNDITFKKMWSKRIPKPKTKQAIKQDEVYTFYKVDEKKKEIFFDRELMRQFLLNLKLRDQAITLALLSSAQDTGDLFKLNIGDIAKQSMSTRIYWTNTRSKTGILFKTFFSKEATRLIRKYMAQERSDAQGEEALFVSKGNKRMTPLHLSSVYRDTAKKIGVKWSKGEHNPLRPKRMRHLFRTACDTAGVSELYTNMFMGHKNSLGMAYSELSRPKAELEYLRVEPFLTVYGKIEETTEIKEEMSKLRTTIDTLIKDGYVKDKKIEYLTQDIEQVNEKTKEKIRKLEKNIREKSFQINTLVKHGKQRELEKNTILEKIESLDLQIDTLGNTLKFFLAQYKKDHPEEVEAYKKHVKNLMSI
jgi:hypothetical protein